MDDVMQFLPGMRVRTYPGYLCSGGDLTGTVAPTDYYKSCWTPDQLEYPDTLNVVWVFWDGWNDVSSSGKLYCHWIHPGAIYLLPSCDLALEATNEAD